MYDANGNRVQKVANTEITNSTFDGADQLSTSTDPSGVTNYSYDDIGNQSLSVTPSGERTTSTWGYENQVGLVALPSGQLVTSTYNADNRRVSKANDDGVIKFNWDPANDNVLLETDETDAVIAEYTNVPVPFGEPLSQNRSSVLSFFHFDGNYSTRQLTDISEGLTGGVIFTGYGEETRRSGLISFPFGYKGAVGYYTDSDTGEIYVRARTYQPVIGRWLSMDPLGFVDGSSLYRGYFVPDGTDPSGESCHVYYNCKHIGGSAAGFFWRCHYACTEDKTKPRSLGINCTILCDDSRIPTNFTDYSTVQVTRLPGDCCPETKDILRIWDTWGGLTDCSQKQCDKDAEAAAKKGKQKCSGPKALKEACKAFWSAWLQGMKVFCSTCKNR